MRFPLLATTLALATLGLADDAWAQGRRSGRGPDKAPAEGTEAPDFELQKLAASKKKKSKKAKKAKKAKDETVRLSEFRGKKPVALVFGSYT